MNRLGAQRVPFFFFFDFENRRPFCQPLAKIDPEKLLFKMDAPPDKPKILPDFFFQKHPISFKKYIQIFEKMVAEIHLGNSFLINLTQPTPISTNLSLREIYEFCEAKFKLFWDEKLVVFSPERFIQIRENQIFTHPMKGTIDANLPDAAQRILADKKEEAEHFTIVDLLRNDLNLVAKNVRVERFRYLEKIETERGSLLQVSSEIRGDLPENWQENVGNLLAKLLPAGSICGAPKTKTVEIILKNEGYRRGFYTGVFGVFDGSNLDSAVAIRFIEKKKNGQMVFKSGGGITAKSDPKSEYQELIDKIYVPIARNHPG